MCSIEEAWAGQNFDGQRVSSQGDIHNAYMSIPDNVLNRGNEFTVSNPNQPQPRTLSRGINSKLSREPRIPNRKQNTNNIEMNISSIMPPINNYGGLEPLPSYMSIYNNNNNNNNNYNNNNNDNDNDNDNSNRNQHSTQSTQPQSTQPQSTQSTQSTQSQSTQPQSTQSNPSPTMTGENFTDVNSAFNISDTLYNFMNRGRGNDNFDDLIDENTLEEDMIINNKYNNMNNKNTKNNKNKFTNINSNESNESNDSNRNMHILLIDILNKLNKIEQDLHNNNKRNMYDIVLYIIVGMLLSFILYSILSGNRK